AKLWYALRLHATVSFPPGAVGVAYLTAAVNGKVAVLLKFDLAQWASGHRVHWATLDGLVGRAEHDSSSDTTDVQDTNYLQIGAAVPGTNELQIQLNVVQHQAGSASIRLAGDTAVL